MGTVVVTDARMIIGQYNISSDLNKLVLTSAADMKEDTVFGSSVHTMKPGLVKTEMQGEGFAQSGSGLVEDVLMANIGTIGVPITLAAEGGDAGESSRFFKGVPDAYDTDMTIGELKKFVITVKNSGPTDNPLVRATIFEDGKTSRTTAGNSSVYTLGAVSSTQKLYAALHVLAFTGTDVTFKVRSAVTNFATITNRITFSTVTGLTSEWATPVSGAITDTFWRVDWTTSGGFTSFSAVVSVGIQ